MKDEKTRCRLGELPVIMAERARLARTIACANPEKVHPDDDLLPWVLDELSGLWLSFDGNYSSIDPREKSRKAKEREAKNSAFLAKGEEMAFERYVHDRYWSQVRKVILKRDNNTCQVCFSQKPTGKAGALHIHHIVKRSQGGTNHFDNLLTVCSRCHNRADRAFYDPDWNEPVPAEVAPAFKRVAEVELT